MNQHLAKANQNDINISVLFNNKDEPELLPLAIFNVNGKGRLKCTIPSLPSSRVFTEDKDFIVMNLVGI